MQTFFLSPDGVVTGVQVGAKSALIALIADIFASVYGLDRQQCEDRLEERERLGSTGFGRRIAIPHGKIGGIDTPLALCVQLAKPVEFDAVDRLPVDLVMALLSPEDGGAIHLQALAGISRLLRDEKTVATLRGANDADAAYAVLTGGIDVDAT